MTPPLCFVLMPFGKKPGDGGVLIDFDAVFRQVIRPAIQDAGMTALRADKEALGGIIHKPMFERLLLCDYAVADLTTANANVFYELGVRHAARSQGTVLVFAKGPGLPFDVAPLRCGSYGLDRAKRARAGQKKPAAVRRPSSAGKDRKALTKALRAARAAQGTPDSPIYQLLGPSLPTPVGHEKDKVFQARTDYDPRLKGKIVAARKFKDASRALDALRRIERDLARADDVEAGVLVDLMLSYRQVEAWEDAIRLIERMPAPVRDTALVQEQLGLLLNRAKRSDEAEAVLRATLAKHGDSSEAYGILGRILKDRWKGAAAAGDAPRARLALDDAIAAYLRGFETDWRDAFPGINAVTLLEISGRQADLERKATILPVVRYGVARKIAAKGADYWDHATLLELAVHARDEAAGRAALAAALASDGGSFGRKTTAANLALIRESRAKRGESVAWADEAEHALLA